MPERSHPAAAARLVLTREQPLRWSDTDALGHVWHGAHIAFIEEVRTAWLDRVCNDDRGLWDHLVVHIEIDIRAPLRYADRVAITTCEGAGFGRSSVRTIERIATPSGELVAETSSVVVAWDAQQGCARPLSDTERRALAAQGAPT